MSLWQLFCLRGSPCPTSPRGCARCWWSSSEAQPQGWVSAPLVNAMPPSGMSLASLLGFERNSDDYICDGLRVHFLQISRSAENMATLPGTVQVFPCGRRVVRSPANQLPEGTICI